jgi:hypothetical protein
LAVKLEMICFLHSTFSMAEYILLGKAGEDPRLIDALRLEDYTKAGSRPDLQLAVFQGYTIA